MEAHEKLVRHIKKNPQMCTSHTVLIVDSSGSMKKCDVDDFKTRSDAAYGTIALDYIGKQID